MTDQSLGKAWHQDRLEEYRETQHDKTLRFTQQTYELAINADGSRQVRRGIQTRDDTLSVTVWRNVAFVACSITASKSVRFVNCTFAESIVFSEGPGFDRCKLVTTQIHARRIACKSTEMDISSIKGHDPAMLHFTDVTLRFCTIDPDLQGSELTDVRLNATDIRSHTWRDSKLTRVNLEFSTCALGMAFDRCQFMEITADREFLESLGKTRGGITDVELRNGFSVHDSVGELRQLFGGVLFYFHVVTMLAFLTPYLTYVAGKWMQHLSWLLRPGTDVVTEPMLTSLLRYIVNGGENLSQWDPDWLSIARLSVFVVYNILRGRALIEVKRIEHSRLITGIWPRFRLDDLVWPFETVKLTWRKLMSLVKAFAIVVVVLGCWHALSFLLLPVPR